MVDSNLQRENILPSDKAKAYKMKLEAIKRQGARNDLTSGQVGPKSENKRSNQIVADESGESVKQIQRYIRLTELDPKLLEMVDEGKIGMTPAVELSYLTPSEQSLLIETINSEQSTPSLSQAQRMKKMSQEGTLNDDSILAVMTEVKKPDPTNISFSVNKIQKYFPKSYTPQKMEEQILKLLEQWLRKRERDRGRWKQ